MHFLWYWFALSFVLILAALAILIFLDAARRRNAVAAGLLIFVGIGASALAISRDAGFVVFSEVIMGIPSALVYVGVARQARINRARLQRDSK